MAYAPQTWVDNNTQYPVSAARMNFMEAGIDGAHDLAEAAQADIDAHEALTTTAHGGIVASSDARLTNERVPTDGSVTNAKVSASAAIAESKLALASDAAAGTASRRTLGTGALQAAPGNHNHDTVYAPISHTHDDRYFTETEMNTKLATKTSVGLAIALGG